MLEGLTDPEIRSSLVLRIPKVTKNSGKHPVFLGRLYAKFELVPQGLQEAKAKDLREQTSDRKALKGGCGICGHARTQQRSSGIILTKKSKEDTNS